MNTFRISMKNTRVLLLLISIIAVSAMFTPIAAHADPVTFGMPSQDSCDNQMGSQSWNTLGIDRPVITSMTVGGETVDPLNPVNDSIGAVVCANTPGANRVGLSVFRRHDTFNTEPGHESELLQSYFADLDGATTPDTHTPITSSTPIVMSISLGSDIGQDYSFSLVHGDVSSWSPTGLGTTSAVVNVTMTPVRTPMGSGESGNFDYSFCTATPPNCHAVQSQADNLFAGLDMQFNQEQDSDPTQFRGAYFALTGAMGGFVTAEGSGSTRHLVASIGAPHFLADGTTPNTGSMQAFLPDASVEDLFGLESGSIDESTLEVSRTEESEGTTDGVPFTATPVTGGLLISVDDITFSSPSYSIGLAGASDNADPDTVQFPENSTGVQGTTGSIGIGTDDNDSEFTDNSSSAMSTDHPDSGYTYPAGLLSFTMTVTPGSTQHISVFFETSASASTFVLRKYNETTHAYSPVTGAVLSNEVVQGMHGVYATYDITDNGALDQDSTSGTIVDPVGLALAVPSAATTTTTPHTSANGTLATTGAQEIGIQFQIVAFLVSFGAVLLVSSRRRISAPFSK